MKNQRRLLVTAAFMGALFTEAVPNCISQEQYHGRIDDYFASYCREHIVKKAELNDKPVADLKILLQELKDKSYVGSIENFKASLSEREKECFNQDEYFREKEEFYKNQHFKRELKSLRLQIEFLLECKKAFTEVKQWEIEGLQWDTQGKQSNIQKIMDIVKRLEYDYLGLKTSTRILKRECEDQAGKVRYSNACNKLCKQEKKEIFDEYYPFIIPSGARALTEVCLSSESETRIFKRKVVQLKDLFTKFKEGISEAAKKNVGDDIAYSLYSDEELSERLSKVEELLKEKNEKLKQLGSVKNREEKDEIDRLTLYQIELKKKQKKCDILGKEMKSSVSEIETLIRQHDITLKKVTEFDNKEVLLKNYRGKLENFNKKLTQEAFLLYSQIIELQKLKEEFEDHNMVLGLRIGPVESTTLDEGRDRPVFKDRLDWSKPWQNSTSIETVEHYRSRAQQGDADAQCILGYMYSLGIRVVKNETEALRLFQLAADKELASAQNNLGYMYSLGIGVVKNETEALRLFQLAANQGLASARNNLGCMYEYGVGVPQEGSKAMV